MKIAVVGDVMLGRLVNDALKELPEAYPWGNTLPIFRNVDLRICNLECVISDIGRPWSKTEKVFHFRTDEKNIDTLKAAQIDIVTIANNHVLDFEYDALSRMLEVLDKHKIARTGSGRNLAEAMQPAICQVQGQRVGVLAFTDNESDWEAGEQMPGIVYVPVKVNDKKAQAFFKHVEDVRKKVDFLVISAHWGPNWGYEPPRSHVPFAHALVDAGADLIFGHSAHIFRGIEIYKKCPIIYSAGDFIDDYAVDEIERNDESFIFVVEKEPGQDCKLALYPTCIDRFQAVMAPTLRREAIMAKMKSLCSTFGTHVDVLADHIYIDS